MTSNSTYVRVINLSIKPDRVAELEGRLGEVRERLTSIPGLQQWTAAVDRDAAAIVAVASYDTKANAEAAGPIHAQILGGVGEYFSAPPRIDTYEVIGSLVNA